MSRRCLICANINPCSEHSGAAQDRELARNDAAIAALRQRPTLPMKEARLHVGDKGSTLWLVGLDRGDGQDIIVDFPPSAIEVARLIRDSVNSQISPAVSQPLDR
jgi:hypothetical protein